MTQKPIRLSMLAAALILLTCLQPAAQTKGRPGKTFSIVAIDRQTGEMGAAVQSHWFSVGSSVVWAESGVGAICTQSFIEASYGPLGLELMRAGKTAEEALAGLLRADKHEDVRQVAMLDNQGRAASHTGKNCIPEAGQFIGAGFSCQANLMLKNTVWSAMAKAFEGTKGELVDRLMQPRSTRVRTKAETSGASSRRRSSSSKAKAREHRGKTGSTICGSRTTRLRSSRSSA